jgi:hypothetical protein
VAAADLLARPADVAARGCYVVDLRGLPYTRLADLSFATDPVSLRLR